MDASLIKPLADDLLQLVNKLEPPSLAGRTLPTTTGYMISGQSMQLYTDIIDTLYTKERYSDKFSRKHVTDSVDSMIGVLHGKGSPSSADASGLIQAFDDSFRTFSTVHTSFIPLQGIQSTSSPWAIGPVTILTMDASRLATIIAKLPPNDTQKMAELLKGHLLNVTCVECSVVAEPTRAREIAEEQARRIVDLLRFAVPTLYPKYFNVAPALEGELISPNIRLVPTVPSAGAGFTAGLRPLSYRITFQLSASNIKKMDELGVSKVAAIYTASHGTMTDYEAVLSHGLHWFSEFIAQPGDENKLLCLVTCLETFLNPRDSTSITTGVASRAAKLLGETLEQKKRIERRVKKLYGLRSDITHGRRPHISEEDLDDLVLFAHAVVTEMITLMDRFNTHKSFRQWITKELILATPRFRRMTEYIAHGLESAAGLFRNL